MPAHEDTSKESTLNRVAPGGPGTLAGSQRKVSRECDPVSANSSSSIKLLGCTNGSQERKDGMKGDFRSIPRRDAHEKLFRDFFELVLQEAVFQVSLK